MRLRHRQIGMPKHLERAEELLAGAQTQWRTSPRVTQDTQPVTTDACDDGIDSISAVTLGTHDMAAAVEFYLALGFRLRYGGLDASFTSFEVGQGYINLVAVDPEKSWSWWGRIIFHVQDVDATYMRALDAGVVPDTKPRDAEWGERYFHITDGDGHELSSPDRCGSCHRGHRPISRDRHAQASRDGGGVAGGSVGQQRGITEQWRGREYRVEYLSKVWLVLVVDDSHAEQVIDTILDNAGTGEIGDGKLFVSNIEEVVRVRTRERGEAAV